MTSIPQIHTDIFGGKINVLERRSDNCFVLELAPDNAAEFRQWFAFGVTGNIGDRVELIFANAGTSSYPRGWEGYRVCARTKDGTWSRVPTEFDGVTMTCRLHLEGKETEVAYFPPFDLAQEATLLASARAAGATVTTIGHSFEGRPLHLIAFGERGPNTRVLWFMARQHPGETQGSYWMEGAIAALAGDGAMRHAIASQRAAVRLVPNMNPDGAVHGNLRTNAQGRNLNRCWGEAPQRAPEVDAVMARMLAEGVDAMLDVHGDEVLPYVFIVGADGHPSWDACKQALRARFEQALLARNPDFQTEYGYSPDRPDHAAPVKCIPWVAQRFDCLALTLEMPFKDCLNNPDAAEGSTIERARRLGQDCIEAFASMLTVLRMPPGMNAT